MKSTALRALRIHVPEVVQSGDTVTLSCEYDLEQVALYSIKWYWNDVEFYRFVPKESPPFRAFPMTHVNIDTSRSGPTEVTLKGVRRQLTGDYKCEVSADGPLFHTEIRVAHMIVADLPDGNPVMDIEPAKVELGKRMEARCYSSGSNPAANPNLVSEDGEEVKLYPLLIDTDEALGLQSSTSRIEMTALRSYFIGGIMTIKCEGTIYSIWHKYVEKLVRDDAPQLAPVLGGSTSHSHTDQVI
ncbi:hypothetical protein NQ318_008963, partial [Aromia moschata]